LPPLRTPDAPVRGERTQVRLATSDDADMLVAWHADPEVARFWDGSTYTREEMVERLTRSEVDPYIVEANGEPIGYLQAWCNDDIPGVAGLDMFLVPSARDRGLGPDAGRAGDLAPRSGRRPSRHCRSLCRERARGSRLGEGRLPSAGEG